MCALGPPPAGAKGLLDFVDDLQVSGHGQLMLQRQDVSGGGSTAYYGQYWNTGAVEGSASVHIEGPLFVPGLSMRCDITRTGNFGINESRWVLTQQIGNGAISYGDISVNLRGSEFTSFFKQIHGTQFEYEIDKKSFMTGFFASEKGAVHRETFAGENTAGPYFLRAAPIIDGSEAVKVDEQVLRFGVDYVLHYETGQLYFETAQSPPRIIPSTSVISVSYQSLRGARGGELLGLRAVRYLGKERGRKRGAAGRDGQLMLGQGAIGGPGVDGGRDAGAMRRQSLAGENTAGPYLLKAAPIVDGSEVVKVDEQVMRAGVDYVLDYESGQLYFETDESPPRSIPGTSVISISYRSRRPARSGQPRARDAVGGLRAGEGREGGTPHRQSFAGENTAGPYVLKAAPIAAGSEVVKVDEQVMRAGVDYVLDYESGELRFGTAEGPPRIIPGTSVISVSYESRRRARGGQFMGRRALGQLGAGKGRIGFSYIEQRAEGGRTSKDTAAYRRDVYYGSGTTGPFETTYRPILHDGDNVIINGQPQVLDDALVVTVDASENIQREGIDYRADYSRGIIEFFRIVPPTSTVYIKYHYEPRTQTAPINTSRRVIGMDISYPVTKNISLESEFAIGGQLDGDQGLALRTGLHGSFKKLDVAAEYRQVQPEFAYISSVGFQRNEKGLNLRAGYEPRKYVRTDFHFSSLQTTQGYSFGTSPYGYGGVGGGMGNFTYPYSAGLRADADEEPVPKLDTQSQRMNLGVELTFPKWPRLRIARDTMSNSGGSGGDNEYENISLDASYAPERKSYQIQASHSISTQRYQSAATVGEDEGTSMARLGTETTNTRMSFSWRPLKNLDFTSSFNTNQSRDRSASGRMTDSQMMQADVRWRASKRVSIGLSHLITKSTGETFGSFFPGGYFGGYGSGDPRSVGPLSSWPGQSRQSDEDEAEEPVRSRYVDKGTRLNVDFRPSDHLTLNAGLGLRRYESGGNIGYRADSDQKDINLSATYMLSRDLRLSTAYMRNDVTFLEEGRGAIENNDILLSLSHGLHGKGLNWSVQYHRMRGRSPGFSSLGTGGDASGTSVSTGASDISANIGYGLSNRSSINVSLLKSKLSGGFGDTDKFDASLGYRFDLSRTLNLDFSYRLVKSNGSSYGGISTEAANTQSYSANILSLMLNARFAGGARPRATAAGYQPGFAGGRWRGTDSELNSMFGDYRTGRPGGYRQGFGASQALGTYGSGASGFGSFPSTGSSFGRFGSYGGF